MIFILKWPPCFSGFTSCSVTNNQPYDLNYFIIKMVCIRLVKQHQWTGIIKFNDNKMISSFYSMTFFTRYGINCDNVKRSVILAYFDYLLFYGLLQYEIIHLNHHWYYYFSISPFHSNSGCIVVFCIAFISFRLYLSYCSLFLLPCIYDVASVHSHDLVGD